MDDRDNINDGCCDLQETKKRHKINLNNNLVAKLVLIAVSAFIFISIIRKCYPEETGFLIAYSVIFIIFPVIYLFGSSNSSKTKILNTSVTYSTQDMTGIQYEYYVANKLQSMGYRNIRVTRGSGDHGADILAISPDRKKCAIQCKHYAGKVGNKAVQEAHAGASYYKCDRAIVITNSLYTKQAIQDAKMIGVVLISRF